MVFEDAYSIKSMMKCKTDCDHEANFGVTLEELRRVRLVKL